VDVQNFSRQLFVGNLAKMSNHPRRDFCFRRNASTVARQWSKKSRSSLSTLQRSQVKSSGQSIPLATHVWEPRYMRP